MNTVCPEIVLESIRTRVRAHHALYEHLTIKDKYWEHTLSNAFRDGGYACKWDVESHEVGKDIVVTGVDYPRISCKSGILQYSKRTLIIKRLQISGFRTTALKTIEEKLNYIDGNHEDAVFSLSSSLFKSHRKYVLTIFLPPVFKELSWVHDGKNYKSNTTNGVSATIRSACSDQLWYEIDYNSPLILQKHDICI